MERENLNYYLQQAPRENLQLLHKKIMETAVVNIIQKPTPQTLLVPVHDPINGGRFLGGEVLVTSAIVQVNGINGWAMVMDSDSDKAITIAIMDGAFAADVCKDSIITLALRGKDSCEAKKERLNTRIDSTRVSFNLL